MCILISLVIQKKQKPDVWNTEKIFIFMEEGMQKALQ